jgi:hypothetical protein
METSGNNDSTASPATTARNSTIHNYQGIKKHLIEAIVFSADTVFACRERLISYDNNDELTCKVDALFHRSKRSSPYLSSHAAREIRRQEYCEEINGNESLRVKFVDTTSTCPSTSPSISSPSDFYYSSIDNNNNNNKSSSNSRRKNRKELEAIPDVPLSLLRLLDVHQHDDNNNNELVVEQLPVSKMTRLSLSAKITAAAATDDGTMMTTTKSSSRSTPRGRIRKNKRRLIYDFILNHIVCKSKSKKPTKSVSVVLASSISQKETKKEEKEKNKEKNENHHHPLHSHSHCHHKHHLSCTNTNTTISTLFHDHDDEDADHDDDDDVNKKCSNTTRRRFRRCRRKNKKSCIKKHNGFPLFSFNSNNNNNNNNNSDK